MNGGEVVVCGECNWAFEVKRDRYFDDLTCPYCDGQELRRS